MPKIDLNSSHHIKYAAKPSKLRTPIELFDEEDEDNSITNPLYNEVFNEQSTMKNYERNNQFSKKSRNGGPRQNFTQQIFIDESKWEDIFTNEEIRI
jgi:hypothetical protein